MGEATWRQILSIGWLLWWRGTAGVFAIEFVVGFGLAAYFYMKGIPRPPWVDGSPFISYPASLIWLPFVVRMALRKHYKGFRIALIPNGVEKVFE